MEGPTEDTVGRGVEGGTEGKSQFKIRHLLAGVRSSQGVVDFLSATDVGKLVPAGEDTGSEESEWELRECREREDFFFFCLIILAFDLYRSWRCTFCPVFLSAVRAVAAHCKLPFCPPPRPVPRRCGAHQGND